MRTRRGFSGLEFLIAVIILCLLGMALIYLGAGHRHGGIGKQVQSASNARQIVIASIMYGADHNDRMPLMINGEWRDLQNVTDKQLTSFGERRTDGWPLLLLPYTKSRALFVNPNIGDPVGIWLNEAKAKGEEGYDSKKNTFRNQSRFPMYGMNYLFLSPLKIPKTHIGGDASLQFMIAGSRSFNEVEKPDDTVFYAESKLFDRSGVHGFFGVNAPGMWSRFSSNDSPFVIFWSGSPCSGDWCGDLDPRQEVIEHATNSVRLYEKDGTNYTFTDGHVAWMLTSKATSGTDFVNAKPNHGGAPGSLGGGAVITDKAKYRWNLNAEFMP